MMQIRPATSDDYPGICELIKSPEELFLVYPAGEYPLTVKQLHELSKWRIEMTVAESREGIVGFANLYDYEPGKRAFIGNVVIDSTQRGRGYGRMIVNYMMQQARTKYALREVHISVFNANTPALLLYSSMGFEPYSAEKRIAPDGEKLALIHMKSIVKLSD